MNKRSSKMINMNIYHEKKKGGQTPDLADYKKNTVKIFIK